MSEHSAGLLATKWLKGFASLLFLCTCSLSSSPARAVDDPDPRPLRTVSSAEFDRLLPSETHLLVTRGAIESFLAALEGTPPDWATVYGHGHHDPGHDERLFNLNRARDAAREGSPLLTRRIAFVWTGELSSFDGETQSYSVAVGPEVTATSWGMIRFKPEEVPSNLRVRPDTHIAGRIKTRLLRHEAVQVAIMMVGVLIPTESIIYDFSHDDEGVGLIMPVVRIDQVEIVLMKPPA